MTRETHLADTYHRSIGSNGVAIASNWRLSASGTGLVVWSPESAGGSVSYGSNANDISSHSAAGASSLVTRADHVHRGVRSVNGQFGNVVNPEDTSYVEVAAAGSTETVDCSVARTYDLTLSANLTLTLSGAVNNEAHYVTVAFRQNGTGGWTVTHPGSVVWADAAPTIDPAAGAVTWVNYVTFDGGTTWYGFPIGVSPITTHDDLTGVTADQHHAQDHAIDGPDHTASGLATGDVLTATSATTFAFQSPAAGAAYIPVDTGTPTYDDTDPDGVLVTVATVWGIDGSDDPYFNAVGVTSGDEAALYWDPANSQYVLVPFDF